MHENYKKDLRVLAMMEMRLKKVKRVMVEAMMEVTMIVMMAAVMKAVKLRTVQMRKKEF